MAREAKIYYQDQLAGHLVEGDGGYVFQYDEQYRKLEQAEPISLTLPISAATCDSPVSFF